MIFCYFQVGLSVSDCFKLFKVVVGCAWSLNCFGAFQVFTMLF